MCIMVSSTLSDPAFLSAICSFLLSSEPSTDNNGPQRTQTRHGSCNPDFLEDLRRMACVSSCWYANVSWLLQLHRRRTEDTAVDSAKADTISWAARSFLEKQRLRETCWSRALPTPEAASRSQELSRSHTIAYALLRLGICGPGLPFQDRVCIHSVGTDAVEGATLQETLNVFEELRRILFGHTGKMTLVLNGMDLIVPKEVDDTSCVNLERCNLKLPQNGLLHTWFVTDRQGDPGIPVEGLVPMELVWKPGVYSESMYESLCQSDRCPDAIFAFNAGLWGYDTWRDTLHMVMVKGTPLVITSYTYQEADDDEEVMSEEMHKVNNSHPLITSGQKETTAETDKSEPSYLAAVRPLSWAWTAERNPFGSLVALPSYHQGEVLRENSFWMCMKA